MVITIRGDTYTSLRICRLMLSVQKVFGARQFVDSLISDIDCTRDKSETDICDSIPSCRYIESYNDSNTWTHMQQLLNAGSYEEAFQTIFPFYKHGNDTIMITGMGLNTLTPDQMYWLGRILELMKKPQNAAVVYLTCILACPLYWFSYLRMSYLIQSRDPEITKEVNAFISGSKFQSVMSSLGTINEGQTQNCFLFMDANHSVLSGNSFSERKTFSQFKTNPSSFIFEASNFQSWFNRINNEITNLLTWSNTRVSTTSMDSDVKSNYESRADKFDISDIHVYEEFNCLYRYMESNANCVKQDLTEFMAHMGASLDCLHSYRPISVPKEFQCLRFYRSLKLKSLYERGEINEILDTVTDYRLLDSLGDMLIFMAAAYDTHLIEVIRDICSTNNNEKYKTTIIPFGTAILMSLQDESLLACECFNLVLKNVPIDYYPIVACIAAFEAIKTRNYVMATNLLEASSELDPRNYKAFSLFGLLYFRKGKFDQCLSSLSRALEFRQGDALVFDIMGIVYRNMGYLQNAMECFRLCFKYNPTKFQILIKLSQVYSELEQYQDSITILTKALDLAPTESELYYQLGRSYVHIHKPLLALQAFSNGLVYCRNSKESNLIAREMSDIIQGSIQDTSNSASQPGTPNDDTYILSDDDIKQYGFHSDVRSSVNQHVSNSRTSNPYPRIVASTVQAEDTDEPHSNLIDQSLGHSSLRLHTLGHAVDYNTPRHLEDTTHASPHAPNGTSNDSLAGRRRVSQSNGGVPTTSRRAQFRWPD